MVNGEQIERCIEEAREKVATEGFAHCDQNLVVIVAVDHMAKGIITAVAELREDIRAMAQRNTVTFDFAGKKAAAIFTFLGGILGGVAMKVFGG